MFEEELERKDETVEEGKSLETETVASVDASPSPEPEKEPEVETDESPKDSITEEPEICSDFEDEESTSSDDIDEGNEFIRSVMSEAISDVEGKSAKRGDIMDAKIVKVSPDGLLVDVGQKSEGFIAVKEISRMNPELPLEEEFSPGDTVRCKVMKSGDSDGTLLLSKKRADFELIWDRLSEAMEKKEILSTTGKKAVKGGILVDLGVTAFSINTGSSAFTTTFIDQVSAAITANSNRVVETVTGATPWVLGDATTGEHL